MIRGLIRLILVVVVVGAIAGYLMGYRLNNGTIVGPSGEAVATTGQLPEVDAAKAREAGAAIGEKVATGASEAQRAVSEMTLQGKIKSKMALDDMVKAADINIDSANGVVTLTGRVATEAERTRAVQLARETNGVTRVVDRLVVGSGPR